MNDDSQSAGSLINSGTPTLCAVRERALELALLHGRSVTDVTDFDREQARRELTGKPAASHHDDL